MIKDLLIDQKEIFNFLIGCLKEEKKISISEMPRGIIYNCEIV